MPKNSDVFVHFNTQVFCIKWTNEERVNEGQISELSIYIWSKNFSHSAYEKSETKMAAIATSTQDLFAAIDVQ
jgi:hypothetical protein